MGMPVTDVVPQGEGKPLLVTDMVVQPLTDLVNGCVVAIPDIERVPDVLGVGKEEGPTVGTEGGEGVTVTERV